MKIIAILLSIVISFSFTHNTHQAFFEFTAHQGKLKLTVKMENADLDLISKSKHLKIIEGRDYIRKHLQCTINDQPVYFKFTSTKSSKNWTYFTFKTNVKVNDLKTLELSNDAFVELHTKFQNDIKFEFGQHSKSYSMDENRTILTVDFE